jgi:hypothetical protein
MTKIPFQRLSPGPQPRPLVTAAKASQHLLRLIIETFVQAGGTLAIVIDETLERRWGQKMRKRGHYRDSALSSHERSVSSPGLRWIVLAVVVKVPLPIRWVLTRDPAGKRPPKALFSTDQTQPAEAMVRDAHEALEFRGDV